MHQRNGALVHRISNHDNRREIVELVGGIARARFKNENKMAVADRSAVVSFIEEPSDDSIIQEARFVKMKNFYCFF